MLLSKLAKQLSEEATMPAPPPPPAPPADEPAEGLTHFIGEDGRPLDFASAIDHLINRELTEAPATAALAESLGEAASKLYVVGGDLDNLAADLKGSPSATIPEERYADLASVISEIAAIGLSLSNLTGTTSPALPEEPRRAG